VPDLLTVPALAADPIEKVTPFTSPRPQQGIEARERGLKTPGFAAD